MSNGTEVETQRDAECKKETPEFVERQVTIVLDSIIEAIIPCSEISAAPQNSATSPLLAPDPSGVATIEKASENRLGLVVDPGSDMGITPTNVASGAGVKYSGEKGWSDTNTSPTDSSASPYSDDGVFSVSDVSQDMAEKVSEHSMKSIAHKDHF